MKQSGLNTTLRAATDTYIWQPWLVQLGGTLNISTTRNNNSSNQADFNNANSSHSVVLTGAGQLRILPQSRFPFEAHVERTDNRIATESIPTVGFASERIGFTQQYMRKDGDIFVAWDRNTQSSEATGKDRQDNLQLTLSHNLDAQRFQFSATHARNEHAMTTESTTQNNLTLQHSYSGIENVSLETMANTSTATYHLVQAENDTRLSQISSMAFWRPEEMPLTVTGGVRLMALAADTGTFTSNGTVNANAKMRNANINTGLTYDISQFVHLNASANATQMDVNGATTSNANQSVGLMYQPAPKRFSGFQYIWSTSASVANQTGGKDSSRQLTLQLSHSLNRSFQLEGGSNITVELSQALSALATTSRQNTGSTPGATATKQITHGAAVSWSMSGDTGMAMMRLSASDSRALDGDQQYFQMINFQASSNLSTSSNTSWNGSLTVQAVRQGNNLTVAPLPIGIQPVGLYQGNNPYNGDFVTTSSGAVTYQNQRFFGIRRLHFVSNLRMNSQALLPMLGGPADQEMAAWENRFDYWIGRTMLRVNTLIARTSIPFVKRNAEGGQEIASTTRTNKSIMFSVSRGFGDF